MQRLTALLAAGALFAAAGAAHAADISISIGPELQSHAKAYGADELDLLRKDLTESLQHALAKPGAVQPQRIDLVIQAATPNRPTLNEMSAQPGLSLSSFGLGGATITGTVTTADGAVQPIAYRWFETDLRDVRGLTTWSDADRTFDWLASDIAHGKAPNEVAYKPNFTDNAAFDSRGLLRQ